MANLILNGVPHVGAEELEEISDCLKSGWLGSGPRVQRFESDFSDYKGGGYAVATSSCSAALFLSLKEAGIGEGDEVITSAMTFCATVNAILLAGATPVLADIDPSTRCLSPEGLEKLFSDRTRAVIPVHYAGYPCEMSAIVSLAEKRNVRVIEDCAHAIETSIDGVSAGLFGDFGCFSFHATKNLTTGYGGMVLASNEEQASRIRSRTSHGMAEPTWIRQHKPEEAALVHLTGFQFAMSDLQAALGIHQLARLEENWIKRSEIIHFYRESPEGFPLLPQEKTPSGVRHAHHIFPVLVEGMTRDHFVSEMKRRGILLPIHYPSLGEHPYYQERFGWRPERWPVAEQVGKTTVSLPVSAELALEEAETVVAEIADIFGGAGA